MQVRAASRERAEKEYSETLEFDTAKIREAIQAGRDAVEREWEEFEPLLS